MHGEWKHLCASFQERSECYDNEAAKTLERMQSKHLVLLKKVYCLCHLVWLQPTQGRM